MSITFDGNDMVWDGTVRFTNYSDPSTGVVTAIFTPAGGVGNLPALVAGAPGLSPIIDSVTTHQVDPSQPLPASTISVVSPGGPGVASHVTFDLYVYTGQAGAPGTNGTLVGCSDLTGTPADGYIIQFDGPTAKPKWVASRIGGFYIPSAISSTSGNGNPRTLCSMTIPAQPFDWRPLVMGYTIVSGTANTRVDLVCRINDPNTGDRCGYCHGITGVTDRPMLIPAWGSSPAPGTSTQNTYGRVTAGNSANIYFIANQVASTGDAWATTNTTTNFSVKVEPATLL